MNFIYIKLIFKMIKLLKNQLLRGNQFIERLNYKGVVINYKQVK